MSNSKINIQDNNRSSMKNVEYDDIIMNPHAQVCLQQLIRVWLGFERDLSIVPLLRRLDLGTYTIDDHLCLLRNLRQQVIEGSRWITRTASSFDRKYAEIRSTIISHAVDEHRDYELLEKDFVATGGKLEDILSMERNIGKIRFVIARSEVWHLLTYRLGGRKQNRVHLTYLYLPLNV